MPTMTPVPHDALSMVAWNSYQKTEDFENTKRWAEAHLQGSLWAVFEAGFQAGTASVKEGIV